MLEQIKVRAACDELGFDPKHARLYLHIHTLTDKGSKGVEFFELSPGESIESRLGPFARMSGQGYVAEQMADIKRMFSDPFYRQMHFQKYYDEVRPVVEQMGLRRVLSALGKNMDAYDR